MRFVGLDLGASFVKGAVLDAAAGTLHGAHRRPFPPFVAGLPESHREVDATAVMAAVHGVLDPLLEQSSADAIVCCGQMHGFVLLDRSGRAVSNCFSWQDQRSLVPRDNGVSDFEVLQAEMSEQERQASGNELKPGTPLATLFSLQRSSRVPAGAVSVASIPDFAIAQLTQAPPLPHVTIAAGLGGFDLARGCWQSDLLHRLRLDGLQWPAVAMEPASAGVYRFNGRDIPCYCAFGDHQTALLGTAIEPNELSINVGTGSQIGLVVPDATAGTWQLRPFFNRQWLRTVTHIPAGRALNALTRLLTEVPRSDGGDAVDPWDYIEREVARTPRTDLVAMIAFFDSACGSRGSLTNLHETNLSIGHLFRAVYHGMAATYASLARRVCPDRSWNGVALSGGVALRSAALRAELDAAFETRCRVAPVVDETLSGLLRAAQWIARQ